MTINNLIPRVRTRARQELLRQLALHRKTPLVRTTAATCEFVLNGYHNLNYDQRYNGEVAALSRLRGFPLQCFWDVGANIGKWTVAVNAFFPKALVYAFEPHPETYQRCTESVGTLPTVRTENFGLSDSTGDITLHCFGDEHGLSSTYAFPHPYNTNSITCKVIVGSEYASHNGITHIDCVKIDVEGAEDKVLRGLDSLIISGGIDIVQFEYGQVNILSRYLLADFYSYFEARGYAVGKVYPTHVAFGPYKLDHEDFRGPNYIACSRARGDYLKALGQ